MLSKQIIHYKSSIRNDKSKYLIDVLFSTPKTIESHYNRFF